MKTGKGHNRILFVSIMALALALPLRVGASSGLPVSDSVSSTATTDSEANQKITAAAFEAYLDRHVYDVPEFKYIAEMARARGVQVYLFGGTASAFLHYVKWDLRRQNGDDRFQKDRFDYDFTNIYRATQDLDIVIDGDIRERDAFQSALQSQFPHFLGSKANWEIRLLRTSIGKPGEAGYKEALLDSYDFMNQNTDTNSTGLVDISIAASHRILDLHDWQTLESRFLSDSLNNRIAYLDSPLHETTSRASRSLNPKIFSVVRALTKAFQYELAFSPADEATIRRIITDFDPSSLDDINKKWLIKNGKKLFQHATDLEWAWNTIEQLGLRQKLMQLDSPTQLDSLAWMMNKEPLRTKALGDGNGATAAELFKDRPIIISHETNAFQAYEAIARSHQGKANFFISRQGFAGEAAVHGSGLYTRLGRQGARQTGFTIRMILDPGAREGQDFVRAGSDFVLVLNRAAVTIIPESLDLKPVEIFELLAHTQDVDNNDRGIYEKMTRRLRAHSSLISDADRAEILRLVHHEFAQARPNLHVLNLFRELTAKGNGLRATEIDFIRAVLLTDRSLREGVAQSVLQNESDIRVFIEHQVLADPRSPFFGSWLEMNKSTIFSYWSTIDIFARLAEWSETGRLQAQQLEGLTKTLMDRLSLETESSQAELFAMMMAAAPKIRNARPMGEYRQFLSKLAILAKAHPTFGTLTQWLEITSSLTDEARDMSWRMTFNPIQDIIESRIAAVNVSERRAISLRLRRGTLAPQAASLVLSTAIFDLCPECFDQMKLPGQDLMMMVLMRTNNPLIMRKAFMAGHPLYVAVGGEHLVTNKIRKILYADSPMTAEKREFYPEIAKILYADGVSGEAIGNMAYDFREPWSIGMNHALASLIEDMRVHRDLEALKRFSYLITIFHEDQLMAFEPEFVRLMDAIFEVGGVEALSEVAEAWTAPAGNQKAPWRYHRVFEKLVTIAEGEKSARLLASIAKGRFALALKGDSPSDFRRFFDLEARLHEEKSANVGEVTEAFAKSMRGSRDSNVIFNGYYEHDVELLELLHQRKSKTGLAAMASRLDRTSYPDEFYLRFVRYCIDIGAIPALQAMTYQSWFARTSDMKSPRVLHDVWKEALRLRSADLVKNLYYFNFNGKPLANMQYYAAEFTQMTEDLILLAQNHPDSQTIRFLKDVESELIRLCADKSGRVRFAPNTVQPGPDLLRVDVLANQLLSMLKSLRSTVPLQCSESLMSM